MKQSIYFSLPIYLKELLVLTFKQFIEKVERYHPEVKHTLYENDLDYILLTQFSPLTYDEKTMSSISFPLIPPFSEFPITITGINTSNASNKMRIGFTFELDRDLCHGLMSGITNSPHVRGDPSPFSNTTYIITTSGWGGKDLYSQFNTHLLNLNLSDNISHADLSCNISHDTPPHTRMSMFKFLLKDNNLSLCPHGRYQEVHAALISSRNSARKLVTIPAGSGPAGVTPVPGNEQEKATELARLTSELGRIQARISEIAPPPEERDEEEDNS